MATIASKGWPPMADHRALRLGMIFLLYIAQGVPLGLFFYAMPAWLSVNGAGAGAIGLVATMSSLPWTLKFFNGFFMDRFAFLAMGRRRAWLMGAQLMIILGLVAFAVASPRPEQALLIGAFSFLIMTATTFQDVAIDGMAVDIVPDEERARANAFMFGGQSVGMAGGAMITGQAIAAWGPTAAFLLVASVVAIIFMLIVFIREREGERLLPWTAGAAAACNVAIQAKAWGPVFRRTFHSLAQRDSLLFGIVLVLSGTTYGVYPALGSMMAADLHGWGEARIGNVQGIGNLVAAGVGIAFGGLLADRIGPKRFGIGVLAITAAMAIGMIALQSRWMDPGLLVSFMVGWVVFDVLRSIALLPIAMRLCDPTVGATQFAIYMALSNLGITFGAAMLPTLSAIGGYAAMFAFIALTFSLSIAVLLAARVGR
ncbi:MAG TPA: MFS transporter [Sphingomicrobium sp.]|nr:MFS transporter [Sphingomicrobium sp.]